VLHAVIDERNGQADLLVAVDREAFGADLALPPSIWHSRLLAEPSADPSSK